MDYMDYQYAKKSLLLTAQDAKQRFGNDLPAIYEAINNAADQLSRELPPSKRDLIHNYAAHLHNAKK